MSEIGTRIKVLCAQQNISGAELARRAGISRAFLSEVINQKRNASGRVLMALATQLGTTVDFLLSDELPKQEEKPLPQQKPKVIQIVVEPDGSIATLSDNGIIHLSEERGNWLKVKGPWD